MQSLKQVLAEIKKLKKMKPKVRQYSSFGDDHHEAIDAQVDVLERRLEENDIWDRWQDAMDPEEMPHALDSALAARRWLDGDNVDGAPSKDWKELAQ